MRTKLFSIFILLLYSTTILTKEYPYQPAHRFIGNSLNYVSGKYELSGINFLNFPIEGKTIYATWGNATKPVTAKDSYLSMDLNLDQNTVIHLNDEARGYKGLVVRNLQRINNAYVDQFIVYLYDTTKKIGSKLIFDFDKFEKYLTQTWDFDHLSKKSGKVTDIGNIQLVVSFNAKNFDFANPQKLEQLIMPDDLLKVQYQKKLSDCRGADCYRGNEFPITDWIKLKKGWGEDITNEYVTYKDLYDPKYGPIIQVVPMTTQEINDVLK